MTPQKYALLLKHPHFGPKFSSRARILK